MLLVFIHSFLLFFFSSFVLSFSDNEEFLQITQFPLSELWFFCFALWAIVISRGDFRFSKKEKVRSLSAVGTASSSFQMACINASERQKCEPPSTVIATTKRFKLHKNVCSYYYYYYVFNVVLNYDCANSKNFYIIKKYGWWLMLS